MDQLKLPNFFIVGAPKAGTTSLYYYLSEHPEVFMSPVKEPNFFSFEEIEAQKLYYKEKGIGDFKEYLNLFKGAKDEKVIGEASVSYLFYPKVPLKIKKLIPDAKIIIILRNPIERAYSHYLMDYKLGYINIPFEEVVYKKTNSKWANLYYQQYIELGFYYQQVKRYIDIFGENQVKIFFSENLKNEPKKVIFSLFSFLKINIDFSPNNTKLYNTYEMPKNRIFRKLYSFNFFRKSIKKIIPSSYLKIVKKTFFYKDRKPDLNKELKKHLRKLYKEDIKKLEILINKDLSVWYKEY